MVAIDVLPVWKSRSVRASCLRRFEQAPELHTKAFDVIGLRGPLRCRSESRVRCDVRAQVAHAAVPGAQAMSQPRAADRFGEMDWALVPQDALHAVQVE